MISWKPTQVLLVAGLAGLSCIAAAPASAQFFGGGFFGQGPYYGRPVFNGPVVVDELDDVPNSRGFEPRDLGPRGIPPRAIARIVNARGYQLTAAPMRAGDRIVAQAADPSGRRARFVIDAYDGALLRVVAIDGARVAALPDDGLPSAQIDKFLPNDRPLMPKPKPPKPRAAKPLAKPPVNAALPQAVKPVETPVIAPAAPVAATPVPAPSEATRAPAPVEQPATATVPAPRAADIGPKVISVAPTATLPAAPAPVSPAAPVEAAPASAAPVLLTEP